MSTFFEKEKEKVAGLIKGENIFIDLIPLGIMADVMATIPGSINQSLNQYLALLYVIFL